jgi:capsule polysaccharide export protein KpsE/RkpR
MSKNLESSFAGRWIRTVARNLRKIAFLCLVVAVASAVYALTRTQKWMAYSVASVPGGEQSTMGLGALGSIAGNLLGDNMPSLSGMMNLGSAGMLDMNLVFQVLTSRSVFERIIFKYDMLADLHAPSMDMAIQKFNEKASVTLTPEGFFVISMEADSREKSAAIVNDIIAYANQELSTIITSRARRSRIAAEELLKAAEESLTIAQRNMERFRQETGLLFPEEQGISMVQLMATLETERVLAEAQLAGISGTMSSSSPAYIEIARTVEYLRGNMEGRGQSDSLGFFPGMDIMPEILREYENFSIDLETRRAIYLMLRQELESLKLEEAKDSPSIEVLVPAVPAALRSYPKRGKMVVGFTAVAFLIALLWMAVITYGRQLLENEDTGPFWRDVLGTARKQLFLRRRKHGETSRKH